MNNLSPLRMQEAKRQSGAVMLITLVAMTLLMLSALALIRSFDTSLTMAGNLSFKRDLVNQGERGMAAAIRLFNTGALSTTTARQNNAYGNNYSATTLASDSHGIPLALINDNTFNSLGMAATNDVADSSTAITVRYVIDRLCATAGVAFSTDQCVGFKKTASQGGAGFLANMKVGQEFQPVYRISIRATGPRNTQAFLQTTITR